MMKKFLAGVTVAAAVALSAGSVSAANLTVVGGETHKLKDFDLYGSTGLQNDDEVQLFDGSNSTTAPETDGTNGLRVLGAPAKLKFDFLGSEAGDHLQLVQDGVVKFDNTSGSNASFVLDVTDVGNVAVPFQFVNVSKNYFYDCVLIVFCQNRDPGADNEGGIDGQWNIVDGGYYLSMAFAQESTTSFIALFGDGSGDVDLDDMAVRISVVPLPPALLMFGAALLGLGWVKRRKQAV